MTDVLFISDFYIDEVLGGAEKNNDAFLKLLSKQYNVTKIKSQFVDIDFLNKNKGKFLIVANFFILSEECKSFIRNNMNYVIYEHDHKYVSNNNPSVFDDFDIPSEHLINLEFYSKAKAVFCQSKLHSEIVYKNTLLQNIVNLAGNIWDESDISILEKNLNREKKIKFGILDSNNKNKGKPAAIQYCVDNELEFELIKFQNYENFISVLSSVSTLVFFPQWVETFSRVAIEARILGCKLITNNLIGATSDPCFALKGVELLEHITKNNQNVLNKFISIIENKQLDFYRSFEVPKVTFLTSLYKGGKYIEAFLNNITSIYLFDTCEVMIYDSASPEEEFKTIEPFLKKYPNIKYKRFETNLFPSQIINQAIKDSTGDYLTTAPVDDRVGYNYLRHMIKNLKTSPESVCLVYGDCLQTTRDNESVESNSSNGKLYEHSLNSFSKENMVKSLPGPMPIWRKSIHEKLGYFREDIKYPIDWELWLRMVKHGYVFKKINVISGLYLFNANGLTTSTENSKMRLQEEARVFFEYHDIFGSNFKAYEPYFSQFK
jgi:GT2 family glycosyltransferase